MYRPAYTPILHNLTVANNKAEGIYFEDDGDITGDPNNPDYPDLQNTIVYYNNPAGDQVAGFNQDLYANFCCIEDCNEPGTTNYNDEPGFAYAVDPNGTPDPNNYHLAYDSFCIDKANPFLTYSDQVDIDGEGSDRQYGDYVDIGADEVYDCEDDYLSDADVHNDYDTNADGIVNYEEFEKFSIAWLSHDPNEPGLSDPNLSEHWNYACNLVDTGDSQYVIDIDDLMEFVTDAPWLWIACWKLEQMEQMAAMESQSQSMMVQPLSMQLSAYSLEAESAEPESEISVYTLAQIIMLIDQLAPDMPENAENIADLRQLLIEQMQDITGNN